MGVKIDDDNLYDACALAEALGMTEKTIRKMLNEGVIKGKKLGRKWYVTGVALKSYFAEGAAQDGKAHANEKKPRKSKQ